MKKTIWIAGLLVAGMVACATDDDHGGGGDPDPEPDPEEDCGDGVCRPDESATTCPKDCVVCGDKKCEGGETATTCATDCGTTNMGQCGNNLCEVGETTTCPNDCPSSLRTVNASSYTIYNLYVAKCGASTWGPDQTGAGYIAPGASFTLNGIPPGCYFMRAENSASIYWQTGSSVTLVPSSQFTWTLNN